MNAPTAVVCPVCKGWGHEPLPITSSSRLCHNCNGEAVQIQTEDTVVFWDIPDFFDYRGRSQTKIARGLAIGGIFGLAVLLLCVFSLLISQTASLL